MSYATDHSQIRPTQVADGFATINQDPIFAILPTISAAVVLQQQLRLLRQELHQFQIGQVVELVPRSPEPRCRSAAVGPHIESTPVTGPSSLANIR